MRLLPLLRSLMLTLFLFFISSIAIQAQTTAFTYQGRLSDSANSASTGTYDLQFTLYDTNGAPISGAVLVKDDVSVTKGIFTVSLDFGSAPFADNTANTLEIGVRPGNQTGAFTILNPRQQLTSAPFAIRSLSAAQADNTGKLGGVDASNYQLSNGSGANITNLNGANITNNTVTGAKIANNEVVRSVNNLKDDLTIAPGSNVSITTSGNTLIISSTQPAEIPDIFGDGSAGDFTLSSTSPLRNLAIGYASLPAGANLQFNNVTINGTLIVPSGFVLRATGDVTIGPQGIIAVNPVPAVIGDYQERGIAKTGAAKFNGGRGIDLGQVPFLVRVPLYGGGAGVRPVENTNALGGEAGGSFAIYANGNITINGNIDISGRNAQLSGSTPLSGGGGGAGGVGVFVANGTINLASNGFIRAGGGNGANGIAGASGVMYGGGGGGGGGVVLLIAPNNPSIANASNITIAGGGAGASAVTGTATSIVTGGGGGASGGDGGDGTRTTAASGAAEPGNTGDFQIIVAPKPAKLIF